MTHRESKIQQAVVVAYSDRVHAEECIKDISVDLPRDLVPFVAEASVEEMHELASMIKLPMAVIVSGECSIADHSHIYDIYYRPNDPSMFDAVKLFKNILNKKSQSGNIG